MYSAQGLFDGLYTPQDLPTTLFVDNFDASFLMDAPAGSIIVNGVMNLTDVDGEYPSYYIAVDGLYGPDFFFAAPNTLTEGFWYWDLGAGVIGGIQTLCLINFEINFVVRDQFADSYLLTSSGTFSPETVTRIDLCNWTYEYPEPCVGAFARLQLASYEGISPEWGCIIDKSVCGGSFEFGSKDGPQNSPVGNYLDSFGDLVFTVS
jgi:hypothetical protein